MESLLQYGATHFSVVLMKKQDCNPHISPPIIAKGTMSWVSTCIFLDTDCDLKCTWSHLPSPAGGKPLLYSPYEWVETTQEPPHICPHLHELTDGYISRHCLHSSHWELLCFLSLCYICTSICSAGWTCLPRPTEDGSCWNQGWNSRDFSWRWPSNSPQTEPPGRAICISTSPHSLIWSIFVVCDSPNKAFQMKILHPENISVLCNSG